MLPLLLRLEAGCLATPASFRVLMKPSRLLTARGSAARLSLLPAAAAVGVPPLLPLLVAYVAAAGAGVAVDAAEEEGAVWALLMLWAEECAAAAGVVWPAAASASARLAPVGRPEAAMACAAAASPCRRR